MLTKIVATADAATTVPNKQALLFIIFTHLFAKKRVHQPYKCQYQSQKVSIPPPSNNSRDYRLWRGNASLYSLEAKR
jgi:hypothetical protein